MDGVGGVVEALTGIHGDVGVDDEGSVEGEGVLEDASGANGEELIGIAICDAGGHLNVPCPA